MRETLIGAAREEARMNVTRATAEAKAREEKKKKRRREADDEARVTMMTRIEEEDDARAKVEERGRADAALAEATAQRKAGEETDAEVKAGVDTKKKADDKVKANAKMKARAATEAKKRAKAKAKDEADVEVIAWKAIAKAEALAKQRADAKASEGARAEAKAKADAQAQKRAQVKAREDAEAEARAREVAKASAVMGETEAAGEEGIEVDLYAMLTVESTRDDRLPPTISSTGKERDKEIAQVLLSQAETNHKRDSYTDGSVNQHGGATIEQQVVGRQEDSTNSPQDNVNPIQAGESDKNSNSHGIIKPEDGSIIKPEKMNKGVSRKDPKRRVGKGDKQDACNEKKSSKVTTPRALLATATNPAQLKTQEAKRAVLGWAVRRSVKAVKQVQEKKARNLNAVREKSLSRSGKEKKTKGPGLPPVLVKVDDGQGAQDECTLDTNNQWSISTMTGGASTSDEYVTHPARTNSTPKVIRVKALDEFECIPKTSRRRRR